MTDMYMDPHLYGEGKTSDVVDKVSPPDPPLKVQDDANPKDRLGMKKPPLELVPPAGTILESVAFKVGAIKYGPYNWRSKKVKAMVYIGAAKRHLERLLDGEDTEIDPVTGIVLHHIGCVRACMNILADAQVTGNLIDDRPPPGAAPKLIDSLTEK